MHQLLVAYALSGFIALGYQVLWFRSLVDAVGATSISFAVVVTGFIGGLAAGGLASQAVVHRVLRLPGVDHPLRAYGVIELLVVGTMVAMQAVVHGPWVIGPDWPYAVVGDIWQPTLGTTLWQLGSGIASVALPCFLMGTTFPLLAGLAGTITGDRWPSALYAANTLGAAAGVLACQFVLLRTLGVSGTLVLLATLNVVLGMAFLWLDPGQITGAAASGPAPAAATTTGSGTAGLVTLATATGLVAGALEGDLFRRATFIVELNPAATAAFVSFWCVAGIFCASGIAHRTPGISRRQVGLALIVALALHQLAWHYVDPLVDLIEARLTLASVEPGITLEGGRNLIFPGNMFQLLVFTGVLTFVPYLLCSLGLPLACDRLKASGHSVDLAYGLNALAFCAGLLAFTVGAPRVNIFYSLKLFPLVAGIVAVWILAWGRNGPWQSPRARVVTVVAAAAVVATTVLVPRQFDRSFFRPESGPANLPVQAMKSDGIHTTFVTVDDDVRRLYFGRLSMSADNFGSQVYMRLMAHFPLLAHPDPERALLICFGVGNTAAAIALHSTIEQLDIVDLNPQVFATAGEFPANRGVAKDPRVRLIRDDGRQFLKRPGPLYDLITSEPPPPLAAGVDRLYSSEYYATAKARLTPTGLMTQWLPLHLLSPAAVDYIVETFTASFPHTLVFTGFGTDLILVGSAAPIDLASIERRFPRSGELRRDLGRLGVRSPVGMIARIVQTDSELRQHYRSGRSISDSRNDLEQLLPQPGVRPVVTYDPRAVWEAIGTAGFTQPERIRNVMMHLGRLRFHVQNFPFESLATVPAEGQPPVALADADWQALESLFLQQLAESASGSGQGPVPLLERALLIAPDQPEALLALALYREQDGRLAAAEDLARRFLAIEPGDPTGTRLLERLLQRASP